MYFLSYNLLQYQYRVMQETTQNVNFLEKKKNKIIVFFFIFI